MSDYGRSLASLSGFREAPASSTYVALPKPKRLQDLAPPLTADDEPEFRRSLLSLTVPEAKRDKTAAPMIATVSPARTPVKDLASFVAPLAVEEYETHGFGRPGILTAKLGGDVVLNTAAPAKALGLGVKAVRGAKAVNSLADMGLVGRGLAGAGENIAYTGIEDFASDRDIGLLDYGLSGLAGLGFGAAFGKARKPLSDKSDFSAWHGSPHDFDEFSLDKIGTGEGAQVYGHGLYFTDEKEIADWYSRGNGNNMDILLNGKKVKEDDINKIAWNEFTGTGRNKEAAIKNIESDIKRYEREGIFPNSIPKLKEAKKYLEDNDLRMAPGNLYKTNIYGDTPVSELNFMRWDKELNPELKNKIAEQMIEENIISRQLLNDLNKIDFSKQSHLEPVKELEILKEKYGQDMFLKARAVESNPTNKYGSNTGENFYEGLARAFGSDKAASELLHKSGINGIQYPTDFQARGTHKGKYNYVVFDDKAVSIAEKNGKPVSVAEKRYRLGEYTPEEVKRYSNSERIEIAKNNEQVRSFVENAVTGGNKGKKILLGKIDENLAQEIYNKANVNLEGFNLELRSDDIRHLLNKHGNENTEVLRGQRAITTDDVLNFANIISNFDSIKANGDNSLTFIKNINGKTTAVTLYATGNKSLSLKTMYANKDGGSDQATNTQKNLGHNARNDLATASTTNNIQNFDLIGKGIKFGKNGNFNDEQESSFNNINKAR